MLRKKLVFGRQRAPAQSRTFCHACHVYAEVIAAGHLGMRRAPHKGFLDQPYANLSSMTLLVDCAPFIDRAVAAAGIARSADSYFCGNIGGLVNCHAVDQAQPAIFIPLHDADSMIASLFPIR